MTRAMSDILDVCVKTIFSKRPGEAENDRFFRGLEEMTTNAR